MLLLRLLAVAVLPLAVTASLSADQLFFSGYSYSIAPSPSYPDSGGKLTDNVTDGLAWPADVTLADVAYLTGWQASLPTITFTFATPVTITSVATYFADSDGSAGVSLPATVTLGDGADFSQTFSVDNPSGSGTSVESLFTGFSITTDTLTLSYTLGVAAEWTMLAEVRAFGAIPEPATTAVILGAGVLAVSIYRRRGRI